MLIEKEKINKKIKNLYEDSLSDIIIFSSTAVCIVFVAYFLYAGTVTVIPHILYIPIILFAYRYPKRGILFSFIIAVLYLILFDILISADFGLYIDAIGRTVVFIAVGIIVSYISEKLHSQKERYVSLFNSLDEPIFLVEKNPDNSLGKITDCNQTCCDILGYTKNELLSIELSSIITKSGDAELSNEKKSPLFFKGSKSSPLEVLITAKSGMKVLFDLNFHKSPSGKTEEVIVAAKNPYLRHEAEKKVTESRFRLEESLKITGLGYWDKNTDEDFQTWSDETFRIFKIPPNSEMKIKSEDFKELIHPEFREKVFLGYDKSISERSEYSRKFKIITGDSEERWVHSRCRHYTDKRGVVIRSLGTIQDITDDVIAEKKASEQAKFFETLLETIPLPVFHKDKDGKYLGCNQAFALLTGKSKDYIIGRTVFDLFDEKTAVFLSEKDNPMLNKSGVQITEAEIPDSRDNIRNMIISKAEISGSDGEDRIVIGVMQDITILKRTKKNLRKSLEEKNVLLQEVHHRVKNNLASITGILEIEKSRIKDEDALRFLDEAENRIQSMVIVHESLYHSDNVGEIDAQVHFKNLFESVLTSYSPPSDVKLLLDTSGCKIDINSAIPCSLVVNEILTNSMKYAFSGRSEGEIKINLKCHDKYYHLSVSDDGIGIPEDISPEKSKTLGIKVIYNIVSLQLMGEISLDRKNGTKWEITWPRKETDSDTVL